MAADGDVQEVRFAVAMAGGVSLAVWMGGLTLELDRLVRLCQLRDQGTTPVPDPDDQPYAKLVELLHVTCVVDVLSGTSAGGINAGALALARSTGSSVSSLQKLWFDEGSIAKLLRDPGTAPWPSLLQGDAVLFRGLREGLREIKQSGTAANVAKTPVELFVTTTLHRPELTIIRDDFGTAIQAADHHGLFHFSFGDQKVNDTRVEQLALAARCSASFPLAFEASFLPVGTADSAAAPDHPDMSDVANASASVYTADGGVLANQPVGLAFRAIFERPADCPVRRVLAFVVPDPGGMTPKVADSRVAVASFADPPTLAESMKAVVGATLDHSIADDLAAIEEHNQQVRGLRSGRPTLMQCVPSDAAIHAAYVRYVEQRVTGETEYLIVRATRELQSLIERGLAPGWTWPSPDDQAKVRTTVTQTLGTDVPADWRGTSPSRAELVGLGWRTFEKAFSVTLDFVGRAKRVAGELDDHARLQRLSACGAAAHAARARVPLVFPQAIDDLAHAQARSFADHSATRPATFVEWVSALARDWTTVRLNGTAPDFDGHAQLPQAWDELTTALADVIDAASGLDSESTLMAQGGPELAEMLQGFGDAPLETRLVLMDVLETLLAPHADFWDQDVGLVQMSAHTGSAVLPRFSTPAEKLTGLQVHHFGAFWKRSWRANDWMWGRLDGAGWLVHVLLEPERLRWLLTSGKVKSRDDLAQHLFGISEADGDVSSWLTPDATRELDLIADRFKPLPSSVPALATLVAAGVQVRILRSELPVIREQLEKDKDARYDITASHEFRRQYDSIVGNRNPKDLTRAEIDGILTEYRVPSERLSEELLDPTLEATAGQLVAVGGAMLQTAVRKPIAPLKTALSVSRRITLAIYAGLRNPRTAIVPGLSAIFGGVLLALHRPGPTFVGWITIAAAFWQLLLRPAVRSVKQDTKAEAAGRWLGGLLVAAALVIIAGVVAAPSLAGRWKANERLRRVAHYLWHHHWAWSIVFGLLALGVLYGCFRLVGMIRSAFRKKTARQA